MSFRCGAKIVNTVNTIEVPQYFEFTCTNFHMKSSLHKTGREYGLQPDFLKMEIEHLVFIKSNFAELRYIWEPYLRLDVLCLASINARHSMEMQNLSGFGIKDCLTETSLGCKSFGTYNKHRELYTFNVRYVR